MAGCPICEDLQHGASGCPHSLAGQALNKYRVTRFLAAGGMGAVYVGEHETLGSPVAIKTLHRALLPQNAKNDEGRRLAETLVARFTEEARRAASLRHPNIVRVEDLGVAPDGTPYLAMEFLEGMSLKELVETSGPLDPARAAGLVAQALEALEFAHQRNIIHRDIKPENLYLQHPGTRGELVKVLDFGIAKAVGDGATQLGLTQTGHGAMGTFYTMSPEQAADPRKVTASSDVFSVGASLFELLTGKNVLFEIERELTGSGLMAVQFLHGVLSAIITGTIERRPRKVRAEIPEWLDAIVARSLAHDPGERFASAGDMAAALQAGVTGQPVAAAPVTLAATAPSQPMAIARTHVAPSIPEAERPSAKMAAARAAGSSLGSTTSESAGERVVPLAPAKKSSRVVLLAAGAVAVLASAGVAIATLAGGAETATSPAPPLDAQDVAPLVDAPPADGFEEVIRLAAGGDCAAAAEAYTAITNSDDAGGRADALVALGDCERASQPEKARARFERALALVADHPGAKRGLAALPGGKEATASVASGKRKPERPDQVKQGTLDPKDIVTVFRKRQFSVKRCHESALKRDPLLTVPRTYVTLEIANSGRVNRVSIPSLAKSSLGSCLVASISRWIFPRSTEGFAGRFPIVFQTPTKTTSRPKSSCDEVSCLVDPNQACCAKREASTPEKPSAELPATPTRSDISKGMAKVRGRVLACADRHPFSDMIKVRFKIAPDGSVASASASGGPEPLHRCVEQAVRGARFPRSQKGMTVSFPFRFP